MVCIVFILWFGFIFQDYSNLFLLCFISPAAVAAASQHTREDLQRDVGGDDEPYQQHEVDVQVLLLIEGQSVTGPGLQK